MKYIINISHSEQFKYLEFSILWLISRTKTDDSLEWATFNSDQESHNIKWYESISSYVMIFE